METGNEARTLGSALGRDTCYLHWTVAIGLYMVWRMHHGSPLVAGPGGDIRGRWAGPPNQYPAGFPLGRRGGGGSRGVELEGRLGGVA